MTKKHSWHRPHHQLSGGWLSLSAHPTTDRVWVDQAAITSIVTSTRTERPHNQAWLISYHASLNTHLDPAKTWLRSGVGAPLVARSSFGQAFPRPGSPSVTSSLDRAFSQSSLSSVGLSLDQVLPQPRALSVEPHLSRPDPSFSFSMHKANNTQVSSDGCPSQSQLSSYPNNDQGFMVDKLMGGKILIKLATPIEKILRKRIMGNKIPISSHNPLHVRREHLPNNIYYSM